MSGPESQHAADLLHLRAAIDMAAQAQQRGNQPFGAVLVAADQQIMAEAGNTQSEQKQVLAHAELNLLRDAVTRFSPAQLATATLYASAEPCPMCCGALFWSGIGRLVFGLSTQRLHEIQGAHPRQLKISAAELLAQGGRAVEVIGPLLEKEAESLFL